MDDVLTLEELQRTNQRLLREIEEHRRVERELRARKRELGRSEERYRSLFEFSRDAVMLLGPPDYSFTSVNPAMVRMFRARSPDDIVSRTPWVLSPSHQPDGRTSRDAAKAMIETALREGSHFFEWTHRRLDGEEFPATVLLNRVGRARRPIIQATVTDITERKRADQELKESEERFRKIFEKGPLGMATVGPDLRFMKVNEAFCRFLGYSASELTGLTLPQVTHPDHAASDRAAIARLIAGDQSEYSTEKRYVRKSGECIWAAVAVSALRDHEGRFLSLLAMVEDITAKRATQEEIHRAQRLESLGILAGGIAHDFNNLLTAIVGNLSLIRLDTPAGAPTEGWIDGATNAAGRARDLAQQLLTFARGGAPVRRSACIDKLIEDSAGFSLRGANVRCEIGIDGDLWPVDVDAGQMSQVVSNLVLNAVESMPGGGTVRIGARNRRPGESLPATLPAGRYVEITVADQGGGIPEASLAHIFDPYFSTKANGSGLGLTICYSILQKHGGTITVESPPGEGTTFHVILPASSQAPAAAACDTSTPRGHGRILVMDDEKMIRDVSGQMLALLGYTVETTCDGVEALDRYVAARSEGRPFDAVILDLTVPGGMGGKETVRRILEADPGARVIVSSGYSNDPVMDDYRAFGFCNTVMKPYEVGDLGRALRDVLGR